jgi:glycosyltransferase involved in cell wall biosynthesis
MLERVRAALPTDTDVRAVIIGDGPQRAALARYLRRHHMDDWVDLPGRLDRAAIHDELSRGALFVAPATLESFGIAALEARSAGLPVVASSRSGVGEFITSGIDGLLAETDDVMVEQMVRLLTDHRLRAAMSAHNRLVPPHHDWDTACRRTHELYELAAARADTGVVRRAVAVPARVSRRSA